jgi:branched-chain amino acid transport system permease protein
LASQFAFIGRLLFATEGLTLVGAAVTLATALGAGVGGWAGAPRGGRRGGVIGGVIGGLAVSLGVGILADDMSLNVGIGRPESVAVVAMIGGLAGMIAGGLAGGVAERRILNRDLDEWYGGLNSTRKRIVISPLIALLLLTVLVLPLSLGPFFAQVVALVAIYILMGLGLNITLGLAGLLDLGFVAFFAVGGYTVALLTSTAGFGIAELPFWAAVPFAVAFAFLFGAFLGLPILGIRGDYLAIATLGFGEIIRILSVSDLFRPILGGPQGITNIPRPIPVSPTDPLAGPNQIYYIALICAALIAFVALRLRDSRIGRAWLAIREDEDVAEALGINLVQTKILAYALGAAFAGLGGAVFVGLVGAMFPTSINLFVSINVAALIIVGGMGSIPGVIVGAIFLIGLPELFREFSEYRFLFYGAALILMMRFRPEGLLPSRTIKRELHVEEDNVEELDSTVGESVDAPRGALYPPERAG